MWLCEVCENVWPVLRDNTSWFWHLLRTSVTLTCPSDASSSNVVTGGLWVSWSHVQAMRVWFKLQESTVRTPRGNSNATTPARKSQAVRIPDVQPQLNRQCSSIKSSRETCSLVDEPAIQPQQQVTIEYCRTLDTNTFTADKSVSKINQS